MKWDEGYEQMHQTGRGMCRRLKILSDNVRQKDLYKRICGIMENPNKALCVWREMGGYYVSRGEREEGQG